MEILLAHGFVPDGHSLAITLVALVAMIIPFFVLGGVCWVFWKAYKRDEDEQALQAARKQARDEWRSAHSS